MWLAVIIFLSVSMVMLLIRAILGPTIFDRLLASNIFTTNIVVLIAALAVIEDSPEYIDVALVYALLNFVATIGFLRFFKYGTFKGSFHGTKNSMIRKKVAKKEPAKKKNAVKKKPVKKKAAKPKKK